MMTKFSEVPRQGLGAKEDRDYLAYEVRWDHHQTPTKAKSQV